MNTRHTVLSFEFKRWTIEWSDIFMVQRILQAGGEKQFHNGKASAYEVVKFPDRSPIFKDSLPCKSTQMWPVSLGCETAWFCYIIKTMFYSRNKIWIALALVFLTVGTAVFHWLYFDYTCWLVPVPANSSVCIQPRSNIVWNWWKSSEAKIYKSNPGTRNSD